jgi:hypothetical protein
MRTTREASARGPDENILIGSRISGDGSFFRVHAEREHVIEI